MQLQIQRSTIGKQDGQINCQGVRSKVGEIRDLITMQKIVLLGLTETWLLPREDINIEGYKWLGIAREGQAGRGGVGIFLREGYNLVQVNGPAGCKGLESVWVTVSGKELLDTLVGVVYVPPRLGQDVEVKGRCSLISF